ncbi:MAG: hypothetical protein MJE68_10135, partial [Proteobacteria bacterium]|nr:hypothetical protein [Pseudomonadota bacterium]
LWMQLVYSGYSHFFSQVEMDSQVENRNKRHGEIYPQVIAKHCHKYIWLASGYVNKEGCTPALTCKTKLIRQQ